MTHSLGSSTFSRGMTRSGEEIFILTKRDIEVQSHGEGLWLRAYCPIHGSNHQRSLSINTQNGWGTCFRCQVRVLVQDFNPQMAQRLLLRGQEICSALFPSQPRLIASRPLGQPERSRPNPSSIDPWQQEELGLLCDLETQGALRLDRDAAWNARAYLQARHIPLDLARVVGVGYLEPGASQRNRLLLRWEDRLIFPLTSYDQHHAPLSGFSGRLLWQWQCCRNETAHKQHLEKHERKRWIKTNPAGWFWEPHRLPSADPVIVVEGPFDRLAVLADGKFQPGEVIALVGTALQPQWLSMSHAVLLALDGDQGGREASKRIERNLSWNQVRVESYCMDSDGGKDWSERWRQFGSSGLEALYAHHALLAHGL